MPATASQFHPNHFVPLRTGCLSTQEEIILDEETDTEEATPSCSFSDEEETPESAEVAINPPMSGNLSGSFNIQKLLELLTESTECDNSIPVGVKNNKYFIIDNTKNVLKRSAGQQSEFWDDCGAWISKSASSPISHFITQNVLCKSVSLRDGQFCVEKQVKNKGTYQPLFPQPSQSDIFTIQRNYATLKTASSF